MSKTRRFRVSDAARGDARAARGKTKNRSVPSHETPTFQRRRGRPQRHHVVASIAERGVDHALVAIVGHQGDDAGVVETLAELGGASLPSQLTATAPGGNGVERHRVYRRVGEDEGDAVALRDPALAKERGERG